MKVEIYENGTWSIETTTPLGISGTYTGNAKMTGYKQSNTTNLMFSKVRVMATADQAGTVNVQQSYDNVNWRTTKSISVVAGTTLVDESVIVAPYLRLNYVNGGVAQTQFELGMALLTV